MAKQYKKLQHKLYPKKQDDKKKEKEKIGKDYLLLGVMIFTIVVTVLGWGSLTLWNRAMYVLLDISLVLTYARRHAKLSEAQQRICDRASLIGIGLAVAMFVVMLIEDFMK